MIMLTSTHKEELEKYRQEIYRLRRVNASLKKISIVRDPVTGRFMKVD